MKINLALLTVALSSALISTAFAGDIKPLHTCGAGPYNFPSPKTISTHTVVCPATTTYYEAQVRDRLSSPESASTLSMQVIKSPTNGPIRAGAAASSNTTVCPANGLTGYGGFSRVTGGAGTYTVKITKVGGTGAEVYDVSSHCVKVNANGTTTDMYPNTPPPLSAPVQQ